MLSLGDCLIKALTPLNTWSFFVDGTFWRKRSIK